jgi:hypothetical protein
MEQTLVRLLHPLAASISCVGKGAHQQRNVKVLIRIDHHERNLKSSFIQFTGGY